MSKVKSKQALKARKFEFEPSKTCKTGETPTDLQQNAGVHKFSELFRRPSSGAEAFEVASMKTIDKADTEPVEEVPGEVCMRREPDNSE